LVQDRTGLGWLSVCSSCPSPIDRHGSMGPSPLPFRRSKLIYTVVDGLSPSVVQLQLLAWGRTRCPSLSYLMCESSGWCFFLCLSCIFFTPMSSLFTTLSHHYRCAEMSMTKSIIARLSRSGANQQIDGSPTPHASPPSPLPFSSPNPKSPPVLDTELHTPPLSSPAGTPSPGGSTLVA
jgi:hypothetical protein